MSNPKQALRIAVLGCGTVGTEVVRILREQGTELAARVGAPLELVGVAVRDAGADRDPVVPRELLTEDATGLVERADLVVELIGGIEPASTLVLTAIERGASVVTANKALLAARGPRIYGAADAAGVDIYFEAAAAGAVPVVRGVRESLAGDRITRVLGIVNGTTNYILDEMTVRGLDFAEALAQAQELGYAEADPTADVAGHDAAAKAAILASLAFHTRVGIEDVAVEGIESITAADVVSAGVSGHVVKLLAVAERIDGSQDRISVRVHPALLPDTHPLAAVRGAFNAVVVEAEAGGQLMFYGQGAGGAPTASAVVGDVVAAARHRVLGGRGPAESAHVTLEVVDAGSVVSQFTLRLLVADEPGVLAAVSSVFGDHGVSIRTVAQSPAPREAGQVAALTIVTYAAPGSAVAATITALSGLDVVHEVLSTIRVEES